MRVIFHIDMDAFFAAVEFLHNPGWRGKPLVVGSLPTERGVVSTCSYEARKFGVKSAMPSRTAYALCPHAIFTHPHMELYKETSSKVFSVFEHYTPYIEGVSIDEAFLDVTGSLHLYGSPAEMAEALKAEIHETCGITCSVGIAQNRLLAKIGSEVNKPNGITEMPSTPDEIAMFLKTKPINVLWGVGKKTCEVLRPYGIMTCGDIQRMVARDAGVVWAERHIAPPQALTMLLGEASAQMLAAAAFGISDDIVHCQSDGEKSVSREYTFEVDCDNREEIRAKYLSLVVEVGRRFRREKRWARTARLKLRDADFHTITRQIAFPHPSRDDIAFRKAALELFDAACPNGTSRTIRLIGFGVTNIQPTPEKNGELFLFADDEDERREKRERLSEALDLLRERGLMS